MSAVGSEPAKAFYGLQPRMWTLDRFFKVYVRESELWGALLGKQIYDEASGTQLVAAATVLAPLARLWVNRLIRRRHDREARYDQLDLWPVEFLDRDKDNFILNKRDIVSADADRKRRLWTGGIPVSGTLRLATSDMRTKELILVGDQDVDLILSWVSPTM